MMDEIVHISPQCKVALLEAENTQLKVELAQSTQREAQLREALQRLVFHIDRITYRDTAQLRLGPGTPAYDAARQALKEST